jgi:3',5'-cyclic-AMP phosphodiesterase
MQKDRSRTGHNSRPRTLAHVSDLHLGRGPEDEANAVQLCRSLVGLGVDHVVVTGDVTHRGRRRELALYERAFAPLLAAGRVTLVPGNHDRLGDDLEQDMMPGARVQVAEADGLHIVRVNSTGPHNRSWIAGHGALDHADLDAIEAAVDEAPAGRLVVIALHHHVLPLPEDHAVERLSSLLGWPFAAELPRGRELLGRLRGRCGLVLHGHRHAPRGVRLEDPQGAVAVYNAGSSTKLGAVRVFEHAAGTLLAEPWWLDASTTVARTSDAADWADGLEAQPESAQAAG